MVSTGSMLIPLELPHPGRRGLRHATAPHTRLVVKAAPRVPVTGVPLMDISSLWILQTCAVHMAAARHMGLRGLESTKIK